jgi:anti-sigma factor RsiW
MKQRADSEKLMIRYLLGDVPEDEQIRIEERFFTDDEYFEQLLALEDDLIDDYVNGELTDREREQFEEYFLASPTRRQRVEFAKTFMRAGSLPALAEIAMPGEARPEPVPWWRNVMVFWRAQSLPRRFALAASVVLVLGGSWLIVDTMRLRNQVEQLQAEEFQRAMYNSPVCPLLHATVSHLRSFPVALEILKERIGSSSHKTWIRCSSDSIFLPWRHG